MTARQYITKYVSPANSLAVHYRIPALVLLALSAFASRWGKDNVSLDYIAKKILSYTTYPAAAKYVSTPDKFFKTLLSEDKDFYTISGYIQMLQLSLGYSIDVAYSNRVVQNQRAFMNKVFEISNKLNINPEWLMIVMYNECKFNHTKVNPYTGAVGLIQFMPATAKALGTSIQALSQMSNVAQLDYVYKYFKSKAGKIYSLYDLYKITFFPISLGKDEAWVFKSNDLSAAIVAKQNKTFDLNSDGQITVGEFETYLYNTYVNNI